MNSTIRLRFREQDYPISRLLVHRARALGLSRSDLARRLGYRDIGGAHKALAQTLTTGKVPRHMWRHLAQALEIDQATLDAVVELTTRQHRDEATVQALAREAAYRTAFKPHLRFTTRCPIPKPTSFGAAIWRGSLLRRIELPPEAWDASTTDRALLIKRTILDHYAKHNDAVRRFGGIARYVLIEIPGYGLDFGAEFDLNGEHAGPIQPVTRSWL